MRFGCCRWLSDSNATGLRRKERVIFTQIVGNQSKVSFLWFWFDRPGVVLLLRSCCLLRRRSPLRSGATSRFGHLGFDFLWQTSSWVILDAARVGVSFPSAAPVCRKEYTYGYVRKEVDNSYDDRRYHGTSRKAFSGSGFDFGCSGTPSLRLSIS